MFSGFDNIAEGFKRFSLDALQDDEEQVDGTPLPNQRSVTAVVPEQPTESVPPPKKLPPPVEEPSEWDWDQENTRNAVDTKGVSNVGNVGASIQRDDTNLERPPNTDTIIATTSASTAAARRIALVPSLPATPVELEKPSSRGSTSRAGGAFGESGRLEREVADNKAPEERGERQVFREGNPDNGLAANNGALTAERVKVKVADGFSTKRVSMTSTTTAVRDVR